MCRVFSQLDPDRYGSQTRSVRLGGHVTSIRLEASFWQVLEEIAEHEGISLGRFLTTLHDEVLAYHGDVTNFTSLLRCSCLVYKDKQAASASGEAHLTASVDAPSWPTTKSRAETGDVVSSYYPRSPMPA